MFLRITTAINSTINPRSSRMDPRFSGGMTFRTAFSGGSVVEYTISRPAATTPEGRQLRARTITQSTTKRANSRTRKTSRTDATICQKRATVLVRSGHLGCQRGAVSGSGLVEEAAFADPRLVLGRHVDVLRTEQEHLRRDALDTTAQPERQTRSEVDETLGVGVVHLREVHDDRHPVAEPLADRARLVVGARVQRGDPVGLRRRGRGRGRFDDGGDRLPDGELGGGGADGPAAHGADPRATGTCG